MLKRIGKITIDVANRIDSSPHQREYLRWVADNGDRILRLNYDLNENSIVFDVGGYMGQWASDIFAIYCCIIHVFEPVNTFSAIIKKRFSKNSKIFIHNFGLSNKNNFSLISVDNDRSSVFKKSYQSETIRLVCVTDFIDTNEIDLIDLIKINIEGGEFDLIEHLIKTGYVKRLRNIQVQFHDFVPDAENRLLKIRKALANTHKQAYCYNFVWEGWTLKEF